MSVLVKIRNFNLWCWLFGHSYVFLRPWLNTKKTGQVGTVKQCKYCPAELKEYYT